MKLPKLSLSKRVIFISKYITDFVGNFVTNQPAFSLLISHTWTSSNLLWSDRSKMQKKPSPETWEKASCRRRKAKKGKDRREKRWTMREEVWLKKKKTGNFEVLIKFNTGNFINKSIADNCILKRLDYSCYF